MRITTILDAIPSWAEVSVTIVGLAIFMAVIWIAYKRIAASNRLVGTQPTEDKQDQSQIFMWIVHKNKQILKVNDYSLQLLGIEQQRVTGMKYDNIPSLYEKHPRFIDLLDAMIAANREGHSSITFNNNKDGKATKLVFRVSLSQNSSSEQVYTLYGLDITDIDLEADLAFKEVSATAQLSTEKRSLEINEPEETKELNPVPNRPYLLQKIKAYLDQDQGEAALFFIDSDNFKYVNDTLGHACGDQLMELIRGRLSQFFGQKGQIFHLGGDKFIIFLNQFHSKNEVVKWIEQMLWGFRQPFAVMEHEVYVTLSIGVSFYPENGDCEEELFKNAELAMYRAKEQGKDRFVIFEPALLQAFNDRYTIEKHLRKAIKQQEFAVHYQPQVCLKTGKILGVEALIRWYSPELGTVSPAKFIKVAEDSRLIIEIGEWVLREACQFGKKINDLYGLSLKMSVNVSLLQVLHDGFIDMVGGILTETGLQAQQLELEITESVFMESFDLILWKLELLKSRGVQFALDDFGTGYSSLSYLERMPISTLKIDKAFIDQVTSYHTEHQHTLAKSIVLIGRNLGLVVVAEGIETKEQLEYVKRAKCDLIQGYLLSKPLTETELSHLLEKEIVYDV
ncbi:diguanylate cyclase (GGDEF)-like protein/PAS domain S-box-containing protein [Paenibacillus turicensis]|uniref:Diguanylate cyclase (GGDEF)-like protein/PAS domain S-box-containing protein n=1 Tax=Paenibacillus turicensis TaxID=160487 RepID=A0ABS4FU24_9BACL|nr:bifunctional diguanylate cyclase/phosphodiesterase [Paenibacillus turicensis]MBP1906057.1 diguanylate cyclase (GGDEF)-like protein/PAS domain S-box-containing protein [Paenibacillus turicensis]